MSRTLYRTARIVLAASLTITVLLATGLAAFVAWAIHPLLPFGSVGGWVAWLSVTAYLLWVLDISLKGLRSK